MQCMKEKLHEPDSDQDKLFTDIDPDTGELTVEEPSPQMEFQFEGGEPPQDNEPSLEAEEPDDESIPPVNIKYPLLRLIGIVSVRRRTEGSLRSHTNVHSSEEAHEQLDDLEKEATELIFEEGKWQEAIDSGVVSKEEINDLMLELYEYLYDTYTSSENRLKKDRMRRFLKKKRT